MEWDVKTLTDKSLAKPSVIRALWSRWLGDRGERTAARFLRKQGMRVILRGYRTSQGEVDLICRDGNCLVFVEVKSRKRGHPAEAVDQNKQRKLTLAAVHFLKRHGLLETSSRFDVVAITWPEQDLPCFIEHFPNAFDAVGKGQMFH